MIEIISKRSSKIIGSDKIELCGIGDSLTTGVGTQGTGSSYSGIIGHTTYLDNTCNLIANPNVTMMRYGYPGQTASYVNQNNLPSIISSFNFTIYSKIICPIWFGANEITYPASTSTAEQDYENIVAAHTAVKNAGAKSIAVTVLNRLDRFALPDSASDTKRLAINALITANWQSFADGFADLSNQPLIYTSDAPNNATYFNQSDPDGLSKVHLTSKGAFLVAKEVSKAFLTLI
jgi:hypothetical protein